MSLVPRENADSEASDGNSSEDEIRGSFESSPPPSLNSSLERLNLLESPEPYAVYYDEEEPNISTDDRQGQERDTSGDMPVTPILQEVFPSPSQFDMYAVPSVSSLLSVPSNPNSPRTPVVTNTRSQRKRKAPTVLAKTVKKRTIKYKITCHWKKVQLQSKAEIPETVFQDDVPEGWSALDYFYRFFTEEIIDNIVMHTNLYSLQEKDRSIKVTKEEILDFLAINLLMGIVAMPSYKDYWKTNFRYAQVADIMPLKRFQQIRRFIHFADNNNADIEDRYYKLRPVIERIRAQCLSVEEENAFSIDEMVMPYKGKKAGSRRQYNPNKPKKWGFKNLVRAGVSGMIYDFMLYAGETTFRGINFTDDEETLGVGAKIVLALCKTIKTPASVVYFDNYFSSLELVYLLRENYGIFSLGTIRQNRLQGADKLLVADKVLEKKGRGSFSQIVCNKNNLSVVKWVDNKKVILVSSFCDAYPVQTAKRYNKERKQYVEVPCPQIVKHYNRHMGGVDLADMLIALYRTGIKSHRWYINIFSQLLDICVNNAWLLRRRHYEMKGIKNKSDLLKDFRYNIYAELLKKNRPVLVENRETVPKKIKKPVAARPTDDVRYDQFDHWPQLAGYQRCKNCKGGQASTVCTKCKVHLCYVKGRNCFLSYHQKN